MKTEDIDQSLRMEARIEPSPAFAARVMVAVREAAEDRAALGFPWKRLLPGLVAAAAIAVAGLWWIEPIDLQGLTPLVETSALSQAMVWIPSALAGSFALVWWSMRWGASDR
jgi:hypothetical protein